MKAVVYFDKGKVECRQIDTPQCGNDEILVQVGACAVCGSDFKTYNKGNPRMKPPITMGHEFSGTIIEAGSETAGYSPGEKIVMATSVSCGECVYCRQGWSNLCVDLRPMGFYYPGGMAEFVVIPARAVKNGHVVKVPESLAAEHAALAEPVSCAVNTFESCGIKQGDTVVVEGAGAMGIIHMVVAKEFGAAKVILAQRAGKRLELAEQFNPDVLINTTEQDLNEAVSSETGGLGADCAVIAAPAAGPQENSVNLVHKKGTVCLFASLPVGSHMIQMDSRKIHYGELRVIGGSDSTAAHVKRAVEILASDKFPKEKLVSKRLPLDEISQAFQIMELRSALRVVLQP
jgi:L-iditol 2-dehydrogenase